MEKPRNKRVTIREIATITGYSISTVSKALNNSHEISRDTKNKITEVGKFLGYKPNKAAISLRSGKNYTIAVIIPSIEDAFYARVFHGIQSQVTNTNYSIITCITNESLNEEISLMNKIYNQVDAFIIAVSQETIIKGYTAHLEVICSSPKPLVILDRELAELKCSQVLSDSFNAIKNITSILFSRGFKRLALVSSTKNVNNHPKVEGFLEVQEKKIHSSNEKFLLNTNSESIEDKLRSLIKKKNIDCVISVEQETSFAVLRVLKQLRKKIPHEVAVIGYMSERVAKNLDVSLSTINQHRKTMGIEAMNLVLSHLNMVDKPTLQKIRIKSTLVRRESY